MHTIRCIWARLYCLSSSSTVRLWAHLCPLVPLWISTMWKESASRRYGVRSWANSVWRVLRSPWDRAKSPIKFKHCITAPRSYWRSSGGIGSRVAVRTARRQSITPRRYTNSTWSTVHQKVVSIETLQIAKFRFLACCSVRNYAEKEPMPSRRTEFFQTPSLKNLTLFCTHVLEPACTCCPGRFSIISTKFFCTTKLKNQFPGHSIKKPLL